MEFERAYDRCQRRAAIGFTSKPVSKSAMRNFNFQCNVLAANIRLFRGLLTAVFCIFLLAGRADAATVVDTSNSRFTRLEPIGFDQVRWTNGFWADRLHVCREASVPSMWRLMESGLYKPFLGHFLIAAGQAEGGHHGAKWNDGDFYKWLEAAIATIAVTEDETLRAAIDRSIEAIAAAQRDDGYLHTPVLIRQRNGDAEARPFEDRHAFEVYNMGHLITTACLHHRVTGETGLLEVAEKAAGFLREAFANPTPELARHAVCPSHYMGLIELYRTTGNAEYLALAEHLIAMRDLVVHGGDDNQDRLPLLEHREIAGHAVRANYLYAGAADLYAETGDPALRKTLERLWDNMVRKKMYVTGACGALYDGASPDGSPKQEQITRVHQSYGRNYQLPHVTAHNETCANIGNLLWSWRMFLVTGEAKYVDVLEAALYNSILSGVSLSGTEYFYVNPLRVVDPLPTRLRYPRTRQAFFTSFCCPPNVVRTIAEAGEYAYSKTDAGVWVNLYGANELKTQWRGQPLQLVQRTNYPSDGVVRIEITQCPAESFALKLRVPGWADRAEVAVDGTPIDFEQEDGYATLRRQWQAGDEVELRLPARSVLLEANPLVEELWGQVAVRRGPVVYCLESVDLPEGVQIEDVVLPVDIELSPQAMSGAFRGLTALVGAARQRDARPWSGALYREAAAIDSRPLSIRLIPYFAWANRGPAEMSVWLPVERTGGSAPE